MNQMLPRPRFWADAAAQLKTRFTPFGELLIFLLIYFLAFIAQFLVLSIPVTAWILSTQGDAVMAALSTGKSTQELVLELLEQMPDWMALVSLFTAGLVGVAAVIYVRRFQKRDLASMGLCGKAPLGEYALGLVLGLALFGAVYAIGTAAGGFRLVPGSPDGEGLALGLVALLGCAVQGAGMELLIRGYFAPTVGARAPVLFAVIVSTVLPAIALSGGSVFSMTTLNSLLLGLLLGIWVLKRGSLWGACAIRGAWYFAGSFLFDVAPADAHMGVRLFDVDADVYRPLLSGGEYGPMESICVTIVLLAAVALALALKPRDPAPVQEPVLGEQPGNNL